MGTLVKQATSAQFKKDFAVTTVVAGSVAVDSDELAIFVGANWAGGYVEAINALRKAAVWAQEGVDTPDTAKYNQVFFLHPAVEANGVVSNNAVFENVLETEISVYWGGDHNVSGASDQSITTHITKLIEKYMETTSKKGG